MGKQTRELIIPEGLGDPTLIFEMILSGEADEAPMHLTFHVLKEHGAPEITGMDRPNLQVEDSTG